MTQQRIIIPVDHGNRNLKTENYVFTSGVMESDCRPMLGEYIYYNDKYYLISDQRIPYMRDKSSDERFFILTLFGIVKEAKRLDIDADNTILKVELPVGLPPKHYGALHKKFRMYFMNRGRQNVVYDGKEWKKDQEDLMTHELAKEFAVSIIEYFREKKPDDDAVLMNLQLQ